MENSVIHAWSYTHRYGHQEHLAAYDSVQQPKIMHRVHREQYAFSLLLSFFSLKGKELSEQGAAFLQRQQLCRAANAGVCI